MNPTPRAEHSPPASTAPTMYDYLIVPRAPLVFRSGRPFGVGGRDAAHFPWPSSLAGLLRTQVLDDRSEAHAAAHAATAAGDTGAPPPWPGTVDREQQRALRALAAHGPLLAHCCAGKITPMLPRPADALLLADAHGAGAYQRLQP
ncbi:MAG TPA: type III-B CRISPR module-associated Cmr3 family protein, partial [Plasticicumulans sp.]|nr:type III-B CRISPR module-associated Cmr3 family protein [Plasticicumulans sp.]